MLVVVEVVMVRNNLIRTYLKSRPKITLMVIALGIVFGVGFGSEPDLEVRKASALFRASWVNYVVGILFCVFLGWMFKFEKVKSYFSGDYNQSILRLLPLAGVLAFVTGFIIVVTTFVRFQTHEYSHLGFHTIFLGLAIFAGCVAYSKFSQ